MWLETFITDQSLHNLGIDLAVELTAFEDTISHLLLICNKKIIVRIINWRNGKKLRYVKV